MCYKRQYSKKEALSILNDRKSKHKKWAKETRIYQCPDAECNNLWHLTSKTEHFEVEVIELKYKEQWKKLKAV
jgi:hypothetical protein